VTIGRVAVSSNPHRDISLDVAFGQHTRKWRASAFCYPVVSRRSGGLSIGVNLNPDKACNFDCIYCQVDRTTPADVSKVDLAMLDKELNELVDAAISSELFEIPPFGALPPDRRVIRDIAFSGDGEPTTYTQFSEAIGLAAATRRRHQLELTKLVLITDACYLTRPDVQAGLRLLDENNGEIWAKLDAGTQAYYETINRPNYPLSHVLANILDAARKRPIVIQSLWMKVHGAAPPCEEVAAYCDRLNEILSAGGQLKLVQLYTIARKTTEKYATSLTDSELDEIANLVRARVNAPCATYYGVQSTD
jgi:wyosine [tRNA(Phe)-imidazoG37] synthetase (radical SAM superfamily)